MKLKHKVYNYYLDVVNDRVTRLQKIMADLKESSSNETKSSAGDKHETALSMLQIEQQNTSGQLTEALSKRKQLEKINPDLSAPVVVNGSLLKTDRGYLFLSVALGKADIDKNKIIALSPQSPLGKLLMGLKAGQSAQINNIEYFIESIE